MERHFSVGPDRPVKEDHLQRWSQIFRSDLTETDLSIRLQPEISGKSGLMESTLGFCPKAFTLRVSLVFRGPLLLAFKTDRYNRITAVFKYYIFHFCCCLSSAFALFALSLMSVFYVTSASLPFTRSYGIENSSFDQNQKKICAILVSTTKRFIWGL